MSDDKRSEANAQTARDLRETAAKNGHQMTQTEARARVDRAREIGDQKRNNGNR